MYYIFIYIYKYIIYTYIHILCIHVFIFICVNHKRFSMYKARVVSSMSAICEQRRGKPKRHTDVCKYRVSSNDEMRFLYIIISARKEKRT